MHTTTENTAGGTGTAAGLPVVECAHAADAIVNTLETAARRGRLAGFKRGGPDGALFVTEAYGVPFESELVARSSAAEGGTRLTFGVRMDRRMPSIFAAVCVLTIWPGYPLTDSLVATYFPGFEAKVPTAWWYLPLTVVPLPWMAWSAMKKSRRTAIESAREMIGKISKELGVKVSG